MLRRCLIVFLLYGRCPNVVWMLCCLMDGVRMLYDSCLALWTMPELCMNVSLPYGWYSNVVWLLSCFMDDTRMLQECFQTCLDVALACERCWNVTEMSPCFVDHWCCDALWTTGVVVFYDCCLVLWRLVRCCMNTALLYDCCFVLWTMPGCFMSVVLFYGRWCYDVWTLTCFMDDARMFYEHCYCWMDDGAMMYEHWLVLWTMLGCCMNVALFYARCWDVVWISAALFNGRCVGVAWMVPCFIDDSGMVCEWVLPCLMDDAGMLYEHYLALWRMLGCCMDVVLLCGGGWDIVWISVALFYGRCVGAVWMLPCLTDGAGMLYRCCHHSMRLCWRCFIAQDDNHYM